MSSKQRPSNCVFPKLRTTCWASQGEAARIGVLFGSQRPLGKSDTQLQAAFKLWKTS